MAGLSDFARSAIRRSPRLGAAVGSTTGQWFVQTVRGASAVRPAAGFVANQLRRPTVGTYRLRESGLSVSLRHRSRDVAILNEIFGGTDGIDCYAPPPEIATMLNGIRAPQVMDLGANIGLFGLYIFGRWPGARITAFEPDPENAALLERTIRSNDLGERWAVQRSACSNQQGTVAFASGRLSEARIARRGEPGSIEVPMLDLFAADHDVDLLKMDIEGGEWAILTDPRLPALKPRAIVMEWHGRDCPEPDPHAAVLRLLRSADYVNTVEVGYRPADGNGLLWAWRSGSVASATGAPPRTASACP